MNPAAHEYEPQPLGGHVHAPLVERFFEDIDPHSDISPSIVERKQVAEAVLPALDMLGDTPQDIEMLLDRGLVSHEDAESMFRGLTTLLDDPEYRRLVLYLPFEVLPTRTFDSSSESLNEAAKNLGRAYEEAWFMMLGVDDVRANFVDGDAIETNLRDEDGDIWVVKAAHLLPGLIERGIVTHDEVTRLTAFTAEEGTLARSLDEASLFANTENEVRRSPVVEATASWLAVRVRSLQRTKRDEIDQPDATANRAAWADRESLNLATEAAGHEFGAAVAPDEIARLLSVTNPDTDPEIFEALLHSVEASVWANPGEFEPALEAALSIDIDSLTPNQQMILATTLRHLEQLSILPPHTLRDRGIAKQTLDAPFSEHARTIEEMRELTTVTRVIAQDEVLREKVAPVLMVGGSRLKGYGDETSDLDIGVFIAPGVPFEERSEIVPQIQTVLEAHGLEPDFVEYWLNDNENQELRIRSAHDEFDVHLADDTWTNLVFAGAWVGDAKHVERLQERLLPYYFQAPEFERSRHLQSLERDVLQYRLLHRGYDRHMPSANPYRGHSEAHLIDGDAAFYDPGYRLLATKLFIQNVFIPKKSS